MPNNELSYILKIKDEATKTLKSFSGEVEKTSGGIKGLAKNFATIAGKATLVTGAIAGTTYAMAKLGEAGGKLLDVETSFSKLAENADSSGKKMLESLQQVSRGTVSSADLMQKSVKASMLGIPIDKMTGLMEIARTQAVTMGEDVGYMLDSIVTGVGRASPLILDNLGITLKMGDVYEKTAEKLGKTSEQLTEAERKQGLLNAVLEWGKEKQDEMGGSVDSNAEAFQRFNANLTNLKDNVLKSVVPALNTLIEPINNILNAMNKESGGFSLANIIPQEVIELLRTVGNIIYQSVKPAFDELKVAFNELSIAIQPLMPYLKLVAETIGLALVGAITAFIAILTGAIKGIITFITGITQFFTGIIELITNFFNLFLGLITGNGELIKLSFQGLWQAIQDIVNGFINSIFGSVESFISGIIAFFQNLYNVLVGNSIIPDMVMAIIGWFEKMSTMLTAITSKIKSFITNAWNGILGFLKSIGSSILSAITDPFEKAWGKIKDLVGKIKEKMRDISPFAKGSPSLVQLVDWGVKDMVNNFEKLKDMQLPTARDMAGVNNNYNNSSTQNNNVVVNAKLQNDLDAINLGNILGQQLAFNKNY